MTNITLPRAELEQVLEALVLLTQAPTETALDYADNAIDALRSRLAQPEQEPVAWMVLGDGKYGEYTPGMYFDTVGQKEYWERRGYELQPLYTAPPQRKPEQEAQTATYTCGVCGVSMQMEQPEPDGLSWLKKDSNYFSQPKRKPLTDERIGQIIEGCKITLVNYCSDDKQVEFARAIEAAHGIKGEA